MASDLSHQEIVYTGATGSLGSYMPTDCVALKTRLEDSIDAHFAELSRLKIKPKVLIHMAALTVVKDCEDHPQKAFLLNVEGASKWFLAAEKFGIQKFIFVSTSHVFATPQSDEPLTVNSPVEPRSVYAKTKWFAEQELRILAKDSANKPLNNLEKNLKKNSVLELIVVRVFSIYSEKMRPGFLYPALVERAKNKDFSPIPGLDNFRDFLHSRDVCAKLIQLASSNKKYDLVLVCSGRAMQVRELAEKVFSSFGLDASQLESALGRADDVKIMYGVPTVIE